VATVRTKRVFNAMRYFPVTCLVLTFCFAAGVASAKIPGNIYLAARGGVLFPGIASEGTEFMGRISQFGITYRPFPDANVGFQAGLGFQINSYRHNFEKDIFVSHVQKGFTFDLLAVMKVSSRTRILTGVEVFSPYTANVDIGQRNFNQTYYFGSDSLLERYERSPVQAAAILGLEYGFGKSQNALIGIRIVHAGISPVKENAVYFDGLGHSVVVSKKMKAISVQLSVSVKIKKRRKKVSEPD
jgi:hypothetical protein